MAAPAVASPPFAEQVAPPLIVESSISESPPLVALAFKSLETWHKIEHPLPMAPSGIDAGDPAKVTRSLQLCDIALAKNHTVSALNSIRFVSCIDSPEFSP